LGTIAPAPATLDQTVAVENRMDGALCRKPDITGEAPKQKLADLTSSPMRLLAFEADDEVFERQRQLVGVANRPSRTVGKCLKTMFLVAIEYLVAAVCEQAKGCSQPS